MHKIKEKKEILIGMTAFILLLLIPCSTVFSATINARVATDKSIYRVGDVVSWTVYAWASTGDNRGVQLLGIDLGDNTGDMMEPPLVDGVELKDTAYGTDEKFEILIWPPSIHDIYVAQWPDDRDLDIGNDGQPNHLLAKGSYTVHELGPHILNVAFNAANYWPDDIANAVAFETEITISASFAVVLISDVNKDLCVNLTDCGMILAYWGLSNCPETSDCGSVDLNRDGALNLADIMIFASQWLITCEPDLNREGHWPFDEGIGTVAYDIGTGGNDLTLIGDTAWILSDPNRGVCLDFDGDGDYARVDQARSGLDFAPGSFSVSAWIKPREVTGGWRTILEYDRAGTNWLGLWLSDAGRFHFRVGTNTQDSEQQLNQDQWYFLTAIYDAAVKTMTMYINGEFDSSATHSEGFTAPSASRLTIGAYGYEGLQDDTRDEFFDGMIDDVRIYDRALSEGEIKLLASQWLAE